MNIIVKTTTSTKGSWKLSVLKGAASSIHCTNPPFWFLLSSLNNRKLPHYFSHLRKLSQNLSISIHSRSEPKPGSLSRRPADCLILRLDLSFAVAIAVAMHPAVLLPLLLLPFSHAAKQTVKVGENDLVFNPSSITAAKGDTIEFSFYPHNHSVAQSTFEKPCQPLNGGIFSGYFTPSTGNRRKLQPTGSHSN